MFHEKYRKALSLYEQLDQVQSGLVSGQLAPLFAHEALRDLVDLAGELVDLIAAEEQSFTSELAEAVLDQTDLA